MYNITITFTFIQSPYLILHYLYLSPTFLECNLSHSFSCGIRQLNWKTSPYEASPGRYKYAVLGTTNIDTECMGSGKTTSRIQEPRDDPHVCLSFLPERGVTGVLELDVGGVRNVIDEWLDDEILSHVGRAVDYERLGFDVVQTVDDRPPTSGTRPNPPGSARQNVVETGV